MVMLIPDEPDTYYGGMHYNRNLAAEVGALIGEFAITEMLVVRMMGILLEEEKASDDLPPKALAILGPIISASSRIDVVKGLADKSTIPSVSAIREALSIAEKINTIRNRYVHALYRTNRVTQQVYCTTWPTSTGRKSEDFHLTFIKAQKERRSVCLKKHRNHETDYE